MSSVTRICSNAFEDGVNLINITIPSGVKQINNYAFLNCKSLSSITIPDSVTTIDQSAFGGCIDLTQITVSDKNTEFSSDNNGVLYNKNKTTLIKYPLGNESTSFVIPNSVNIIDNSAFSGCSNITSITIPNNITYIGQSAFYGTNLTDVYYNGTENDWNNIKIGTNGNTSLTNATRTYFAYINIFDKDGNKVIDTMQNMGEKVNVSSITVPENSVLKLYTDKDLTIPYSLDMPISENLNLYYDIIEINKLKITGTESADIGQKGITESVTFATDKAAKDFIATIKFSDKLNLSEVKAKDFSITEQSNETNGGYTYLYLTCAYKNDGNIPKNTTLNPFDLVFDVSESATANEKMTIEFIDEETFLAGSGTNTYDFDGFEKAEIKVNPVLVKSITINGADEIDKATKYTAAISPENATNTAVEWTVDNSEIATISTDGTLTPKKAGTVKITATAKDGSRIYGEKTINVKVYAQITSLTANTGVWNKAFTTSEREYIIYVPKNTTSIKLTAEHSGTLNAGTQTLYSGRPKSISLTGDESVLNLTYSQTGYTNSTYAVKIIKFEGTQTIVSTDGKTFTIKPINIANGNNVILALYNGKEFVEAQYTTYRDNDITFTSDKAYTNAKVMVWDNPDDMTPICDVEVIK